MKKYISLFLVLAISILSINAQENQTDKYRRSSLALIIVSSDTSDVAIPEINTLRESQEILLTELKNRGVVTDQLKAEMDEILWANVVNVDVGGIKKLALNSWGKYPFPDKYDNHGVPTNRISLAKPNYSLTAKDNGEIATLNQKIAANINKIAMLEKNRAKEIEKIAKKDQNAKSYAKALQKIDKKYGEPIANAKRQNEGFKEDIENVKAGGTNTTIFTAMRDQKKDIKNFQPKLEQQLTEQRVAHQLVKKWFSSEDGKMFDMSTIQKRGLYDATQMDFNVASATTRGKALLADAGEELINNTFVAVVDLNFFSNKPIADLLVAMGKAISDNAPSGMAGLVFQIAAASFFIAAKAIEDGYTVFSKAFLYKLKWNDEIAAKFYNIWGDEAAFNNMDFELEFVGVHYQKETVNAGIFSKKENRQLETIIRKLVIRNVDNNFATLQKNYDVFKVKVPIISTNPITAEVGMKEGLKGGERFEILQMTQNPETGRTKWVRVGTTTLDKKILWDNRYNAGDEPEKVVMGKDGIPITASAFKDALGAQPGMYLRQIK